MKLPNPRLPGSFSLCFSHDGEMLACVGTHLNIFSTSKWERLCKISPFSNLCDGAFSRSGHMFAVKNALGRIAVVHPKSGQVLSAFKGSSGEEAGSVLCFVSDDSQLADGTWDGMIRFRSPLGGDMLYSAERQDEMVVDLSYDHDSRFLWIACQPKVLEGELSSKHDSYLLRLDLTDAANQQKRLQLDRSIELSTQIECVRLSPDGRFVGLATQVRNLQAKRATPKQQFQILSAKDGTLLCKSGLYETPFPQCDLSWSPDARFVVAPIRDTFVLLETKELNEVGRIAWHYAATAAFHPSSSLIALGSMGKSKIVRMEKFFA